ncbi:MAG: decaprenyl-phosphate phosphoribosyltransferase [bacterium]|nr:decaprenyl-phosphate phosphoribosyltransferase [bacterium]
MLTFLLISMRPKQWVKNLFVFGPLLFVKAFTDTEKVALTSLAFVCFCIAGSAVYLLNDCLDKEKDRQHPIKKHRPLASGKLSAFIALTASLLLGGASLWGGFMLNRSFGWVLLGYLLLNLFYSLKLKDMIILDVFCISIGFVLRVVGGAAVIAVPVSVWILACTFFLALFLAVNKRKNELTLGGGETREVLRAYSPEMLEYMNMVSLSATVITYAFYTFSSEHSRLLMLTIPIVLYGLFYYLAALARQPEGAGDPTSIVLKETNLQVTVMLWVLVSGAILLLAN